MPVSVTKPEAPKTDPVRRLVVGQGIATLTEGGDLVIPIGTGVISADDVRADLYELSRGTRTGRTDRDAITLFENGGGGHLDLMVARHVWGAYQAAA